MRVVFAIRIPALLVVWVLSLLLVVVTIGDAGAQVAGQVPGRSLGQTSDSEYWRQVRRGDAGRVSIPGPELGVLIQSGEYDWRAIRNGPLSTYGAWLILGSIAVFAGFFLLRGRIRIKSGLSGKKIERFNEIERFAHWLMAMSFMILGCTGLNMLYGRYVLRPLIGDSAFAWLVQLGKYTHHYVAFAFMIGLALVFILWVTHNIPSRVDLIWFIKGGGIIGSAHPPAKKFNGGQKILFWLIMLGGVSMSMSGLALMFPFETTFFADTFSFVNILGLGLPENLTLMQEQQFNQIWHGVVALLMVGIIIGHIYIGTVGMQGAFDAMKHGQVDVNWAKEHHSLWAAERDEPLPTPTGEETAPVSAAE